jgi:HPt (histidine-containing phosphotransfer) domain-containing protein
MTNPPKKTGPESDNPLVDSERLEILRDALGNERLLELFSAARQSIEETAAELRRNWSDGDRLLAGKAAHRLVGVAANFGFPALAAVASAIERDCAGKDDCRARAPEFEEILRLSLAAAKQLFEK